MSSLYRLKITRPTYVKGDAVAPGAVVLVNADDACSLHFNQRAEFQKAEDLEQAKAEVSASAEAAMRTGGAARPYRW
jgi:hypothetical protein